MLNTDIINFGTPGGSIDTLIRIFNAWYTELKPPRIFCLLPTSGRYEINGKPVQNRTTDERWQQYKHEIDIYDTKVKLLETMAIEKGVIIHIKSPFKFIDLAWDKKHMGKETHKQFAKHLHETYRSTSTS